MEEFSRLSDKELRDLKETLRLNIKRSCSDLLADLKKEESRRQEIKLSGPEIIKGYLMKYIKFELHDGLGSYEVWKVKRIDDMGNKTYTFYPEVPIVSCIDGSYSIDTYLENMTIETTKDLDQITVIQKEEYDTEFDKALNFYKSLKK